MNRKLLRMTLVGLVALVVLAAIWPSLSAAVGFKLENTGEQHSNKYNQAISGACTPRHQGVTLVVDFGSLLPNSKPLVRCATSSKTKLTGWTLFAASGFRVAGTSDYPTGFVCRINGYPTRAQQDCQHTPNSVEGTWVYYTAGSISSVPVAKSFFRTWHFSPMGASMSAPICGDYQGWRFVKLSDGKGPLLPRYSPRPFTCE